MAAEAPPRASRRPPRLVLVAGLAIAAAGFWAAPLLRAVGLPEFGVDGVLWLNWLVCAALVGWVFRAERRDLASLRLTRPTGPDWEWCGYAVGAAFLWSLIIGLLLPRPPNEGIDRLTSMPIAVLVALVLTTAVTEEVIWRGYGAERLGELLGSRSAGLVVSAALFCASHLPFFGGDWLLYNAPTALLLYVLYATRRNLVVCMVLHLVTNAPILVPALAAR